MLHMFPKNFLLLISIFSLLMIFPNCKKNQSNCAKEYHNFIDVNINDENIFYCDVLYTAGLSGEFPSLLANVSSFPVCYGDSITIIATSEFIPDKNGSKILEISFHHYTPCSLIYLSNTPKVFIDNNDFIQLFKHGNIPFTHLNNHSLYNETVHRNN